MNETPILNGNGKNPQPLDNLDKSRDESERALGNFDLSDLVSQAVMDKLEEARHLDTFLNRVIENVRAWHEELGIEAFQIPAEPAPRPPISEQPAHGEPQRVASEPVHRPGSQAIERRQLYIKYENDQFSALKTRLLVSSLDNNSREGGIYELDFANNTYRILIHCDGRGMAKYGDGYVIASRDRGLFRLDRHLNVVGNMAHPHLDLHGIAVGPDGLIYVAETKHNRIGIFRADPFERIDEIVISHDLEDVNHVNDVCFRNGNLLVCMFSTQEPWRKNVEVGVYDGAIFEYDIREKQRIDTLASGLKMPHTLKIVGIELCYCESFALNVVRSGEPIAQYIGFTRGLDFDGHYFYVGQSRMRHRRRHKELTVSNDAGIHILEAKEQVSRFVQIPVSDIYGVLVIE